jgi:hypothetical protein
MLHVQMSPEYNMALVDQWCVLTENIKEKTRIMAIHLPSLSCLPAPTPESLISANGVDLMTDEEKARVYYSVNIAPSRDSISRHEGTSEYTVILSEHTCRFAFDIRIDVIPGSIYGKIVWPGTRLSLPDDQQLQERISSEFPTDPRNPFDSRLVAIQRGFEVLVTGIGIEHRMQILRMTNLRTSDHTLALSWISPLRSRTGASAAVERKYQGDPNRLRGSLYWDSGTGMLLLRGPPLADGALQECQSCWF